MALIQLKNGWNEHERMKQKTKNSPSFVIKVLKHARGGNLGQFLETEL